MLKDGILTYNLCHLFIFIRFYKKDEFSTHQNRNVYLSKRKKNCKMKMLKKFSLVLMIVLYISAGINHFIHPESYYPIIPPYFPFPALINIVSGLLELILGIGLMFAKTRNVAASGIIILLILFIPAHIYMIQKGGCMS